MSVHNEQKQQRQRRQTALNGSHRWIRLSLTSLCVVCSMSDCIAKPLTALLAFILSLLDLYGDSSFDWSRGYPYLAFITNMSQIWVSWSDSPGR